MINKFNKKILVTGATGHQGGAVLDSLIKDGWSVTALTRGKSRDAVLSLERKGADIIIGDLNDKEFLRKILKGFYGVFLVTTFIEDGTEAEIRRGKNLASAAKEAGVEHFIFSSVGSANLNTGIPHFDSKYEIEKYIKEIGLSATIFRPVSFTYNYETPEFRESVMNGLISTALPPESKIQLITLEDLGAFVCMAFDDPVQYIGKSIDLASDELTMTQIAFIFGRVIGRDVLYEQIPIEELEKKSMEYARMYRWMIANGYHADIIYLRGLNPKLMSFEDYLIRHGWESIAIRKAA